MKYKYYKFKDSLVIPSPYGFTQNKVKTVLSDSFLEEVEVDGDFTDLYSQTRVDTSNKFTGDPKKIKNIHFVRGAIFDRDFFRRMYPDINIRNNIALADVIVYDDKSLFQNESKYIKLAIMSDGTIYSPSYFNGIAKSLIVNDPNDHQTKYNNLVAEIGPNSKMLHKIAMDPSPTYKYFFPANEYISEIIDSKKPFLGTDQLMDLLPCKARANKLTYETTIVLFEQLCNNDRSIADAAAEALIMYDSSEYLPLQLAMLLVNSKIRGLDKLSNKLLLFMNTYAKYTLNRYVSRFNFIDFIVYIQDLSDKLSVAYPAHKYDFALMYKVIKSDIVFKKLWGAAESSSINNTYVEVNYIDFKLKSKHFDFTNRLVDAAPAKESSIEGFLI